MVPGRYTQVENAPMKYGSFYFATLTLPLLASAAAGEPIPSVIDLADPDPVPVIEILGDDLKDLLGSGDHSGIAFGDLDGDGIDDLIVGVYRGDGYLDEGVDADNGEAYVFWGSEELRGQDYDLDATTSSLERETRIYGDDNGDVMGRAVATGDFDGDGIADLAMGAFLGDGFLNNSKTQDATGEVILLFGGAGIRNETIDFNTGGLTSIWRETRIYGDDKIDSAGFSVAFGDLNADGYDDLLMSSTGADRYDGTPTQGLDEDQTGRIYVIWGAPQSRARRIDLNTDGPLSEAGETRISGDEMRGAAGISLASGDINGDGYDDVVFGATSPLAPGTSPGRVFIVYGSAALEKQQVDLSTGGVTTAWGETRISGDDIDDRFGHSVAVGDIDGDGFGDIVVSAPNANGPGGTPIATGEAYIIWGAADLGGESFSLDTDGATSPLGETRILGRSEPVDANGAGSVLGISVSCGDVNGDGLDDVLVGSIMNDGPTGDRDDAGSISVIYGSADLRGRTIDLTTDTPDVVVHGADAQNGFGFGLEAGGDVDFDGFGDFAAAAIYANNPAVAPDPVHVPEGGNFTGAAYVVHGDGVAKFARAKKASVAGTPPVLDFGSSIRAKVKYTGGDASFTTMTLYREDAALAITENLAPPEDSIALLWELDTDRSFSSTSLTFTYLNREVDGVDDSLIQVFYADQPTGPWRAALDQVSDRGRNRIGATFTQGRFFAIRQVRPDHVETTMWGME